MDVSVIMPAYNAEKYIGKAIESVLCQRFAGQYELIIVDDDSTDSTADIIASYQSRYPNIIRFSKNLTNKGANANRYDFSIKAQGKYLAFIDADDMWLTEDKLQRQFDFLESHNDVGAVCSNACYIYNLDYKNKSKEKGGLVPFNEMIAGHTDIFCSSLMCRNDIYKRMAEDSKWYIDNNCFNDTLWALWLSYNNMLYRMEDALSAYRVLDNSACHSTDKKKKDWLAKRYFKEKICFLLTHDYPLDEKMDIISDEYDYIIKNAYYAGEKKVRATKTFKAGKRIKDLVRIIKRK